MNRAPWSAARARDWLDRLQRRGMVLGLERVEELSARLDHPEQAYPSILIAGTNGKGTVAALLDAILVEAGYRVGRYTSPHLVDWVERITVDRRPIGEAELAAALQGVEEVTDAIEVTPFEALTLAAFWHFRRAGIDWGVIEAGLGGRLDATRICRAEVTVITTVGLDHTAELGSTLEQIAREKGAIARSDVPLVTGSGTREVRGVLQEQARRQGAEGVRAEEWVEIESRADQEWGLVGTVRWRGPGATPTVLGEEPLRFDFTLPLAGAHMTENVTTALAVLGCLRARGVSVPTGAIGRGLAGVHWPGRLHRLAHSGAGPDLLLDVGHNPQAVEGVVAALACRASGRPRHLVVALADDKDLTGFLRPLIPGASRLVATAWTTGRARDPGAIADRAVQLAAETGARLEVLVEPDPARAVARGAEGLGSGGLLLAIGSHMLVGALLARMRDPESPLAPWRVAF